MTIKESVDLANQAFNEGRYCKNIAYLFPRGDLREFEQIKSAMGSVGMTAWLTMQMQRKHGLQIQVEKQVSDDLRETDFKGKSSIGDIPWPAYAVEMYFEDPKLPTILLCRVEPLIVQMTFPGLLVTVPRGSIHVVMQHGSGSSQRILALNLSEEKANEFIQEAETESMPLIGFGVLPHALSDQDHAVLAEMIRTALKVFAFASIPRFKPSPLTRKQMTHGGKSGVNDRPETKSVRVVYLPEVRYTDQKKHEDSDPSGLTVSPHRRRGHLRFFRDDRFVHVKNTWTLVAPAYIHGGNPIDPTIYKIRNPK